MDQYGPLIAVLSLLLAAIALGVIIGQGMH